MQLSAISLAITRPQRSGTAAWSPSALFTSGEQGAWYDPSDLSTMFQDRAGTTPVTADGQTVGKILDKSGRGNHATAPSDAARMLYKTDGTYHWLLADGVNDTLDTSAIDLSSTNKAYAIIGIRNNDASGFDGIYQQGGTTLGAMFSYTNGNLVTSRIAGATGDSAYDSAVGSVGAATNRVQTTAMDLSGGTIEASLSFRVNAATSMSATSGAIPGGGNFKNDVLSIGTATGVFLGGNLYSFILVGKTLSTPDRDSTETWVNSKTGAY
jgi:hypothetical protein